VAFDQLFHHSTLKVKKQKKYARRLYTNQQIYIYALLAPSPRDIYFDIKNSNSPKMPLTPFWLQALDIYIYRDVSSPFRFKDGRTVNFEDFAIIPFSSVFLSFNLHNRKWTSILVSNAELMRAYSPQYLLYNSILIPVCQSFLL